VYVAGVEYVNGNGIAKVWKNGVATPLTNGQQDAQAYSVFLAGNDVHVAGNESNGTETDAKIWKNGQPTATFSTGVHSAYALSVYVSGNDIYVSGIENNGSVEVAKVWKNGQVIFATLGQNDAVAHSVFVVN